MKTFKNCGLALAIAAALLMTTASCSSENDLVETPNVEQSVQPTTDGVKITVSAGIGDSDGTTRAAVDYSQTDANGKPIRTLTFTTGDRLYVTAKPTAATDENTWLAGYVTIAPTSISPDGKSASFEGDLQVWDKNGYDVTDQFTFGANPLDECSNMRAFLVPKDAPDGLLILNKNHTVHDLDYTKSIAADVNTLMKTAIKVSGGYNGTTKTFNLTGKTVILNCAIGHLTANNNYTFKLRAAINQSEYEANEGVIENSYDGTVTTDDNGVARFAIGLAENDNLYYVLQLKRNSTTREYVIGQKTLSTKVYNVKKDNYALCKFTVNVPSEVVGSSVSPGMCNVITVSDGKGHTYSTQEEGLALTFMNGQANFQFQMDPVTDATLVITGVKTSTGEVYVGTIEHETLAEFGTYTFDPVTMGKGKDLSAGNITAANGDVICQSSEVTNHTITIPDGFTVTLAGVNINTGDLAGIICQGSANIILSGSNSVQGGGDYPAVQAGPTDKTLTISGNGSLTATGGSDAAGIGSGNNATCGNINIIEGSVTATGGSDAAGIGCGRNGNCGRIYIIDSSGTATKGAGAPCSIGKGAGDYSSCGDITVNHVDYGTSGISESPFTWSVTP